MFGLSENDILAEHALARALPVAPVQSARGSDQAPRAGVSPNAMIVTRTGLRRAGSLSARDKVMTRARGFQPLLWAGTLASDGARAVICAPGSLRAFGGGSQAAIFAPGQRLLLQNPRFEGYFGANAILCAASHLAGLPGVGIGRATGWTQLMLDRNEVLRVDGKWAESFAPDLPSLRRDNPALARVLGIVMPGLRFDLGAAPYQSGLPELNADEARLLHRF